MLHYYNAVKLQCVPLNKSLEDNTEANLFTTYFDKLITEFL